MKITQDLHVHTHLSLCAKRDAFAAGYIETALKCGIETLGIADHLWDHDNLPVSVSGDAYSARTLDWVGGYRICNVDHVMQARKDFADVDKKGVRVLFGCELEFDPIRRKPAITVENAKKFDFIIVPNSHTHLIMPEALYYPKEAHAKFMKDAFMDICSSDVAPFVTAIAHPFTAVGCYYDYNLLYDLLCDEDYIECFSAAKAQNIAIEINVDPYFKLNEDELKSIPELRMYRLAKKVGCKFTFGTDSHATDTPITHWPNAQRLADILELTEKDVLVL